MSMDASIIEKMYTGFLGMDAGMRLGAPVENPWWTYERLRDYFGTMTGYLREQKTHPADDDVNGPVMFLRALTDNSGADFTEEQAGETWLNYTRCGRGMFWWGGEDVSTEHRAYMNLRRGIRPPASGSIAQNGLTAAEQIGGQIFVDTWGLICPGDPDRAAALARKMASVSHDGEALHGAAFMAAAVAAAFTASSVDEVIDAALARIPADCGYRRVVDGVRAFHRAYPEDFRACRDYVEASFPNPGGYHILPNAGICVTALLYGDGDFGKTVETAVMCGFDTDCNASNVGTILGVLTGDIPRRYRDPINDTVILSGVSGYLNMLDAPTFAKELAAAAGGLRGEKVPAWADLRPGVLDFDFAFPGATHGLTLSEKACHELRWRSGAFARSGRGCLEMQIDGKFPAPGELSFRACFLRSDFESERYEPVFSPRVYPGQRVSIWLKSRQTAPAAVWVTPFITLAMGGERIEPAAPVVLPEGEWTELGFTVPDLGGDQAHEIGWRFDTELKEPPWAWGKVFIDRVTVDGPGDYTIDTAKQRMEFGEPTPFSTNDAAAKLEAGALVLAGEGPCQAFTGNYYAGDASMEADVAAEGSACLLLRGQGTRRYYALGFSGPDRIAIARWEGGRRAELAGAGFRREPGRTFRLRAEAKGSRLRLWVDGELLLFAEDDRFSWGMAGVCQESGGVSRWSNFHVRFRPAGETGPEE